jgi:dihydroneopterin aldolase
MEEWIIMSAIETFGGGSGQAGGFALIPYSLYYEPFSNNGCRAMDIVFIRDLRIETVIGIYEWEREITQTVVFDLEMGADIKKAADSDAIEDTLDYKAVSKRLVSFVRESQFQLVETLAERCADIVLNEFNVPWVRLTLNKIGAVSMARDVGVIIERSQGD